MPGLIEKHPAPRGVLLPVGFPENRGELLNPPGFQYVMIGGVLDRV
jgi:hypothetical protein